MHKNYLMILISIIYLLLISFTVNAPPQPHNVRGRVFYIDGVSPVANGVSVSINNTNNSDYVITEVYSPPTEAGWYAATINGTDNDTIIVTAWNSTNYGTNTTILAPTTTFANIILNTTRPSETNVTITIPTNDSIFNKSAYFNVTAKINIIGGQNGTDCSATITFSDTNVLNLAPDQTETNNLGNITLGSSIITSWNISANLTGNSDISVYANCSSDEKILDNLNNYTASNITVQDTQAPVIALESPLNNSKLTVSNSPVTFRYNVSDDSKIANCSLIINNKVNKTNYTITRGVSQIFDVVLSNNTYNWSMNCTDNSTSYNTGSSTIFNLSIIPNKAPVITNMVVNTPIDLSLGSTIAVYCNATVNDENNASDIIIINSTLYHSSVEAFATDDNNNHYTNQSCNNVSIGEYEINVSCSFNIEYYANNGTWTCNISAIDNSSATGSSNETITINDLLAIDVSPSVIDYGKLQVGQVSLTDFIVNITNFGNTDFNVTVEGYGVEDDDGLAMDCVKGNIPLMYEKYSTVLGEAYNDMTNLTDIPTQISNMTLPQRTNDTTYKNDRNYTYWKIGIPTSINGDCSGSATFAAVVT